jgi:photosystem II stability/assembly factor-like uncharacterized protein
MSGIAGTPAATGAFSQTDMWTPADTGIAGSVQTLALSPAFAVGHTLYAGTVNNGVFRSTDGCATWQAVNQGLTDAVRQGYLIGALAISPGFSSDHTLFAFSGGVFRSTNGGSTWQLVKPYLPYPNSGIVGTLAISPAFVSDHTIYAAAEGGNRGVFRSTDGGTTWQGVNQGLANADVWSLAISPAYAADHTLFAETYGAGLFRSTDSGESWQPLKGGARALAVSSAYATDHTLFSADGALSRSTDGGASWQVVIPALSEPGVRVVALSPAYSSDHTLYAGGGSGLFRSVDSGATWQTIGGGLPQGHLVLMCGPSQFPPTMPRTTFFMSARREREGECSVGFLNR